MEKNASTAYFAAGCFWCVESVFKRIKGVKKVVSGYSGGDSKNPTSHEVASGITNHAETLKIIFDPKKITYEDLLYVFFRIHDPTTKNRQGADAGTQYRSAIFYLDKKQKTKALRARMEAQKEYEEPIVSQITKFSVFYKAEEHHQDYYRKNRGNIYCKLVIDPKLKDLKKHFKKFLKN